MIGVESFNLTTSSASNLTKVSAIPLFTVFFCTWEPNSPYPIRLIVIRKALAFQILQLRCDGFRDQLAVETPIFNEDLVGVHAGDDHASQVNTRSLALQRLRIGLRPQRGGIQRNSNGIQKL